MDAGIIAALIGAAATLTVAGVGFWQWRRSGLNAERNAYRQQRAAILQQLWENLQSLEAESRVNRVTANGFAIQKQGLNNFLHLNAPLLRTDEQTWAKVCVHRLQDIEALLAAQPPLSPDNEAWSATETNPPRGCRSHGGLRHLHDPRRLPDEAVSRRPAGRPRVVV